MGFDFSRLSRPKYPSTEIIHIPPDLDVVAAVINHYDYGVIVCLVSSSGELYGRYGLVASQWEEYPEDCEISPDRLLLKKYTAPDGTYVYRWWISE